MFNMDIGDFFGALYPIIVIIIVVISFFARISKKLKEVKKESPVSEDYSFLDFQQPAKQENIRQEYSVSSNLSNNKTAEFKSYNEVNKSDSYNDLVDKNVFEKDLEESPIQSDLIDSYYSKNQNQHSPLLQFEKYSYIKQAVIMSEILGKPKGLQD